MNSGPGATGGIYLHEKYAHENFNIKRYNLKLKISLKLTSYLSQIPTFTFHMGADTYGLFKGYPLNIITIKVMFLSPKYSN